MPKVAHSVNEIGTAPPFEITNLVSDMKERGKDIIDLSVGQPDFKTPERIIRSTKKALDNGHTTYTPSSGLPMLRRAIVDYLHQRHSVEYDPDQVIVTPGGKFALYQSIRAVVGRGDEVVMFDPVWSSYEPMVKLAGGDSIHLDLSDSEFHLEPALNSLNELVHDGTKLILLNSPVNPSGMVYSEKALYGIRDLAVDHDILVISDEIYKELIFEKDQPSIAALDGMFDRTITINGVSKTYSMTGYRLGFLAGPPEYVRASGKIHSHSVSCASNFVQHAATTALREVDVDAITDHMIETYRSRGKLLACLLSTRGISIPKPEAAFYAMIPIESDNDMQWCKDAVTEAGVGLVPGVAFNTPGYARASLVDTEDRIQEAISRLDEHGFI